MLNSYPSTNLTNELFSTQASSNFSTRRREKKKNMSSKNNERKGLNGLNSTNNSMMSAYSTPFPNKENKELTSEGNEAVSNRNVSLQSNILNISNLQTENLVNQSTNSFQTTGMCIGEKVLKQISENQANFMQRRINIVEERLGDMCSRFASYARAHGRMRDKGDGVSKAALMYSKMESIDSTSKLALGKFANYFSTMQDYTDTTLRRIEEKVVKPITSYGTECKQAQERIRRAYASRKRELDQKIAIEKAKNNTHSLFAKSHYEMQKSGINQLRVENEVEQEIEMFERKKLTDLKQIMTDFVSIEIFLHLRSLEILTQCMKDVEAISIETDLELFRLSLKPISTNMNINANKSFIPNQLTNQIQTANQTLFQNQNYLNQSIQSNQYHNSTMISQVLNNNNNNNNNVLPNSINQINNNSLKSSLFNNNNNNSTNISQYKNDPSNVLLTNNSLSNKELLTSAHDSVLNNVNNKNSIMVPNLNLNQLSSDQKQFKLNNNNSTNLNGTFPKAAEKTRFISKNNRSSTLTNKPIDRGSISSSITSDQDYSSTDDEETKEKINKKLKVIKNNANEINKNINNKNLLNGNRRGDGNHGNGSFNQKEKEKLKSKETLESYQEDESDDEDDENDDSDISDLTTERSNALPTDRKATKIKRVPYIS